jgi:mRNA interferase HigB
MRVIAIKMLREFWQQPRFSDAENPLRAWYREAKGASWKTTKDVKDKYRNASFLGDNRVVFNIHGNKYRLVVHINYSYQIVNIKFIGTHRQYDEIDTVNI